MAQDMKNIKTKWPTGGHLGLDRETKWHAHVWCGTLSLCQVWKNSVKACLRNGTGQEKIKTKWPTDGHLGLDRKTKWHAHVCGATLSLCQVWKKSIKACLCKGTGHEKIQTKTHPLSSSWPSWAFCPHLEICIYILCSESMEIMLIKMNSMSPLTVSNSTWLMLLGRISFTIESPASM